MTIYGQDLSFSDAKLADLGLARDAVDFVIPTHVHLDHAGGAGLLMQALPHARMLLHPRGVRHLSAFPNARYFRAFDLLAVTTSEIKVSALIKESEMDLAVRLLHTAFGLDEEKAATMMKLMQVLMNMP